VPHGGDFPSRVHNPVRNQCAQRVPKVVFQPHVHWSKMRRDNTLSACHSPGLSGRRGEVWVSLWRFSWRFSHRTRSDGSIGNCDIFHVANAEWHQRHVRVSGYKTLFKSIGSECSAMRRGKEVLTTGRVLLSLQHAEQIAVVIRPQDGRIFPPVKRSVKSWVLQDLWVSR
jgi:hypothetical protein